MAVVVPLGLVSIPMNAGAASNPAPVGLGTADSFAVLAGSTVTNTGPTVVNGDLGVSPGNSVTGFPPGTVNGTVHSGDAVAAQAQSDLTAAYNDAAGRSCDVDLTGTDLGGLTLTSGVYCFASSAQLTGTLTLDAQGDPSAVFIFQIGSTLTTASGSNVSLINGAQSCNVFWKVGSSATLGTNTRFKGSILALTSNTLNTNATVDGRTLARNGAVTLDSNTITRQSCSTSSPTPSPTGGGTSSPSPSPSGGSISPSPSPTGGGSPSPSPTGATSPPSPSPTDSSTSPPSPPPTGGGPGTLGSGTSGPGGLPGTGAAPWLDSALILAAALIVTGLFTQFPGRLPLRRLVAKILEVLA
ncbi:MAG: hypothetical protein QOG16_816 [Actinomycetota bacterium]|nr:hypothetical protein [Actinomycetota bacterium]